MVYQPEDGRPSKYSPGSMLINFVDLANVANHCTANQTWMKSVNEFVMTAAP